MCECERRMCEREREGERERERGGRDSTLNMAYLYTLFYNIQRVNEIRKIKF